MSFNTLSSAISDVYTRTLATGKITPNHRRVLMQAICSPYLDIEERSAIDRLLWSATRGRVQMIDD